LANPANPFYPTQTHPALASLADEFCVTLAHLFGYVGALALLAILGIHLWDQLPSIEADKPSSKPDCSAASPLYLAFSVSQFDLAEKTATYDVLRHPDGGRKDILRWAVQGETQVPSSKLAELFAHAELGRGGCAFATPSAASADWHRKAEFDPARPSRCWFSCNFFAPPYIIVSQCGRIDLVTSGPRRLKPYEFEFGDPPAP
jgi:hypothetical protein